MPLLPFDARTSAGLIALQALEGVGARTVLRAASAETEAELVQALPETLDLDGLTQRHDLAARTVTLHEERDVRVVGYWDADYPPQLQSIPDPPPVLFVRGDVSLLSRCMQVAVVGTRAPNVFGASATNFLTERLARAGFAITSGLALGVDAIAHQAALASGAPTIAVLASGLDNVSPPANRALARDILSSGGVLVSEQMFGASASAHTLVQRNRIQSGLALGLLVGQSPCRSGTMHTVRYAAEQGRPIWCPQPQTESPESAGLTVLLQEPAAHLHQLLPAFQAHARLCRTLAEERGTSPLARGVTRANVEEMLAALREASQNDRWSTPT